MIQKLHGVQISHWVRYRWERLLFLSPMKPIVSAFFGTQCHQFTLNHEIIFDCDITLCCRIRNSVFCLSIYSIRFVEKWSNLQYSLRFNIYLVHLSRWPMKPSENSLESKQNQSHTNCTLLRLKWNISISSKVTKKCEALNWKIAISFILDRLWMNTLLQMFIFKQIQFFILSSQRKDAIWNVEIL